MIVYSACIDFWWRAIQTAYTGKSMHVPTCSDVVPGWTSSAVHCGFTLTSDINTQPHSHVLHHAWPGAGNTFFRSLHMALLNPLCYYSVLRDNLSPHPRNLVLRMFTSGLSIHGLQLLVNSNIQVAVLSIGISHTLLALLISYGITVRRIWTEALHLSW